MEFGVNIPFARLLGFELQSFEGGQSEMSFDPGPDHLNSFGVVHGGVCMTLLDTTMGAAARSVQREMGAITIEMKTSFMQAARGKLVCKGLLKHRTASMAFVEATIYDAEGKACAHSTGTFKYMKRQPTGPKSANTFNAVSTD